MAKPPTLEYQTPPKRGRRQRTASLTICIGILNLLCVLVPVTAELGVFDPHGKFPLPPSSWTTQDVLWATISILTGMCFIVGGVAVHRPHRLWEHAIRACAAGQGMALIILIAWTMYHFGPSNRMGPVQIMAYVLQMLSLVPLQKQFRRIGCDD
jgi:hypothetical protein